MISEPTSVSKGSGYIIGSDLGVGIENLLSCLASGDYAKDVLDHDPAAPDSRLSLQMLGSTTIRSSLV